MNLIFLGYYAITQIYSIDGNKNTLLIKQHVLNYETKIANVIS